MAGRLLTEGEIGIRWDIVYGYPCQQKLITKPELGVLLAKQDAKTYPIVKQEGRREAAQEIFADVEPIILSCKEISQNSSRMYSWQALKAKYLEVK
jgi:hypothetical protein